jgi:hypothetical protein
MPDQVAANNKLVVFRGRAERERARLPRAVRDNGLVSESALRRFQKRAGHNPPKPEATQSERPPSERRYANLLSQQGAGAKLTPDDEAFLQRYENYQAAQPSYSSDWQRNLQLGYQDYPSRTRREIVDILGERVGDAPLGRAPDYPPGAGGGRVQGNEGVGVVGGGTPRQFRTTPEKLRTDTLQFRLPAQPSELAGIGADPLELARQELARRPLSDWQDFVNRFQSR